MNNSWISKFCIYGLFAVPLTIFPFVQQTLFPMVTLKFTVFTILIELIFLAWLWLALTDKTYRPKKSFVLAALLVLLIVMTVTSMLGFNPFRSFWSSPERLTGLVSLWHFFAYFLILYSLREKFEWRRYLSWTFITSCVVGLFAFVPKIAPHFFLVNDLGRPGSFFGNPAFLSGYLLFAIALGVWLAQTSQGRTRTIYGVATAYQVFVLFAANTRGSILGLIIGALVFLGVYAIPKLRPFSFESSIKKNRPLLTLLAILLLIGSFAVTRDSSIWTSVPGLNRFVSSADGADETISNRLVTWELALKGGLKNPVWGAGWENFNYVFYSNYDPRLFRSGFVETHWDRPHNIFIEYFVTGGFFGIAAYLGMLATLAYVSLRRVSGPFRAVALGLLAAYSVHSFFLFDTFGTYLLFAVFTAYLASEEAQAAGTADAFSNRSDPSRPVQMTAMAVAAILVGMGIFSAVQILRANHRQYWGVNYMIQNMPEEGITSFKDALAVSTPFRNDIRLRYLQAFYQAAEQTKIPNAKAEALALLEEYKKVIATDPESYIYRYALAEAKLALGARVGAQFYNGSESDIMYAIALSPNRQQNLITLSKIRYLQGNFEESVRLLKQTVDLDPLSPDSHYYYALMLINTGWPSKARAEFDEADRLGYMPKDVTEARQLGDHFGDTDLYDRAVYYYTRAIRYNSKDADAHLKLGLVYSFMGDGVKAREAFAALLLIAPDFKLQPDFSIYKPYFDAVRL